LIACFSKSGAPERFFESRQGCPDTCFFQVSRSPYHAGWGPAQYGDDFTPADNEAALPLADDIEYVVQQEDASHPQVRTLLRLCQI
jgi:hypothetical protein